MRWFLIFCIIGSSLSNTVDYFKMDIRIDEVSTHDRIYYSSDNFGDLQRVITTREAKFDGENYTQLCSRGAFLLYEKPHYVANDGALGGISFLSTNTYECISLDELRPLGSGQSITGQLFKAAHITFFPNPNFMGIAMPVSLGERKRKPADQQPTVTSTVNSLITVGQLSWRVVLADGTELCIKPKNSVTSVCFLSNLVDNVKIFATSGVKLVRKHCRKNETGLTIELTECQELGSGLVRTLKATTPETSGGGDAEKPTQQPEKECKQPDTKGIFTPEQESLILARLNGSLGADDWMQAVKKPTDIWKTEIFGKCLEIFLAICDDKVIDDEYMVLFASLYFRYLDAAWEKSSNSSETDVQFSEADWMEINYDLDNCLNGVSSGSQFKDITRLVVEAFKTYESLKDITDKIELILGLRPNYDYVMEINWILANTVAAACHAHFVDTYNFIQKFWAFYHPLYFTPVLDQWQNVDEETSITYKYIFGGYGMAKYMAKIGFCGHVTMVNSQLIKPYPRPIEVTTQAGAALLPK